MHDRLEEDPGVQESQGLSPRLLNGGYVAEGAWLRDEWDGGFAKCGGEFVAVKAEARNVARWSLETVFPKRDKCPNEVIVMV